MGIASNALVHMKYFSKVHTLIFNLDGFKLGNLSENSFKVFSCS